MPASHDVLVCPAPAKLNLFLHVVGRRGDGYHLLETVFRFIDYGDTLTFSPRTDGQVRRAGECAGIPPEQDLVVRAGELLRREAGIAAGVDIRIDKRIPLGGGLGGGSSDAATTLIALNRLWNLGWTRQRLQSLGLRLGADVPVFVFGRSAFAQGIGERLQPVVLPPAWYLVLVPPVPVATAEIFSDPDLTRDSTPITISPFSAGAGRNDLEAVCCRRHPEVAEHLRWLRQYAPAAITGSGACVFAAFEVRAAAERVLRQLPSSMRGFVAAGLDRHPLCEWMPG
jgi:4-diphosphocytidyl-2-C-methyl-D-erythritol kinase